MSSDFQVVGENETAPFTLKVHRGEGAALLAMNWKDGRPPDDFVGFAIEYTEPGGGGPFTLKNRIGFLREDGSVEPDQQPTTVAPIQKFRWVHFPRNAELRGDFSYKVSPVFMNDQNELSSGEPQEVSLELRRETYPDQLNVTFTRGFVSSQAFVDHFESAGDISTLLPANADDGLNFTPTHPKTDEALPWMGFEARSAILEVLDQAIEDDQAQVRVVAYDLNEPEILSRLEKLKKRVKAIIDDSGSHGEDGSAENQAYKRLQDSAGPENVKRQHMGNLQHNKTIVVDGPNVQRIVVGSTNYSWRGLYVQANNAIVLHGEAAVALGSSAFDAYWAHDDVAGFGHTPAAQLHDVGLDGIDAQVAFSPHTKDNVLLGTIAADIEGQTTSSLLYSLAFLYQIADKPGTVRRAVKTATENDAIFVYGMSDRRVGGIDLQKPDGNVQPVRPEALTQNVPEPFKSEPTGGGGIRMHHKFVVIDFDKPTARVYMGSYNFSGPADTQNGENLLFIKDRRIATAYMVEALRLFDHYHFRVAQKEADAAGDRLFLARPPRPQADVPWWEEDYSDPHKVRDREMFA
jgi:phosphatidylserine/phosphatidylglycerophosphate/cardiolipin synthase-like enzyme